MLKQTKNHTFYEVWSEDAAESVYVDHRPTKEDVNQIWDENWPNTLHRPQVFKEAHVYTRPRCVKCSGHGYYSYSTNPRVKCTDCKGRGVVFDKNPKTGKVQIKKNGKVIGEQG